MEYKFRGKTNDGEWVYGDLVHNTVTISNMITSHTIKPSGCIPIAVIPETVGKYTLLKDKNEKEIYVGDNCRIDSDDYSWEAVVGYDGEVNTCDFHNDYDYTLLKWLMQHSFIEVEVIGNIHD